MKNSAQITWGKSEVCEFEADFASIIFEIISSFAYTYPILLPGENILEKLEKLSENQRQGFDKRFEISQPDIKKRLVTEKFKPSKTVTISIEGEIDFNTIYADKENGIDILKIRTDDPETIKAFTRKMEAESEV